MIQLLNQKQNTAFLGTSANHLARTAGSWAFGQVLYHFPVLDSTNAFALKLLSETQPKPGTIVSADYQMAGRGQFGRSWHSAPGLNLCLSCICFPKIPPHDQFRLNIIIALAVRDTVCAYCDGSKVRIKWPNDIYVGDKKIAGILMQNSIQWNAITSCVAGIGLNVNETAFLPELPNPTSLQKENNTNLDITHVREQLFHHLNARFKQLHVETIETLKTEYIQVLYRKGQEADFRILSKNVIQKGMISEVEDSGRLGILWDDGRMTFYHHGEIELA